MISCCRMSPTVLRVERYRFFFFSSPPELTRIHALVLQHHEMLLEAWYGFFRP
jgi:hypothetical protein